MAVKLSGNEISLEIARKISKSFDKSLRKFEIKVVQNFRRHAANFAPKRTGDLRRIILGLKTRNRMNRSGVNFVLKGTRKKVSGTLYIITNKESENQKIRWVNYGTGIYGPHGKPIRPKKKKALRWVDNEGVHFAKEVKGQKGQEFLEKAAFAVEQDIRTEKF